MNLSQLRPPKGQVKKQRRVGQGMGSGRGKYSGRGQKGQRSISGYSKMRGFEGGQMPLHRRLPKRGFRNIFKKEYAIVNLGRLDALDGDSFSPERLKELGVVKKLGDGLKILAAGELKRKIHVKAHLFSEEAEKQITALGGSVEKIELRKRKEKPAPARAQARAALPKRESKPAVEPAQAEASAAGETKPETKAKTKAAPAKKKDSAETAAKPEAKKKAPAKTKKADKA
jgi:large subunit ribosomal protein L15